MFNKIGYTIEEIERELEIKNLFWFIVSYDYFKITDKQREFLQNRIKQVLYNRK